MANKHLHILHANYQREPAVTEWRSPSWSISNGGVQMASVYLLV